MNSSHPKDTQQANSPSLKRDLKNRHIQLIALGGAIGTGLFLGSAGVIKSAGPSMLLGYAIGGLIAFLIMRQLGEMIVAEPVAGSFSYFSYRYWGDFPGFLSGWNYWALYILVGMSELTAVGKYVHYWYSDIPSWATAAVFFVLINLINLANVKIYGELEFWFAMIKVLAVIGMIALGTWLLTTGLGGPQATVQNLWSHGGFFPNGSMGLVVVLPIIMFSFGGLELIGITAAETAHPETTIPKAVNQVIYRILIFYIGALAILLSLYPWDQLVQTIEAGGDSYGSSPFVQVFSLIGSDLAANVLNFVVLTAALSVYNSGVYCTSRMLYGLAEQGNAPRALCRLDKRGVPLLSLGVSALITALCVAVNYLVPKDALTLLMSLVVSALVINWAMISLAHLKFRRAMQQQQRTTTFRALWYPFGNYACVAFVAFILLLMFISSGFEPYELIASGAFAQGFAKLLGSLSLSVLVTPLWLALMWFCYKMKPVQA